MAKFESLAIVHQKLEAKFGKNAPKKDCIIATFKSFCETGTVRNREGSGRLSKPTEEKLDEAHDVTKNQQQTNFSGCCHALLYFSNNSTSNYD